MVRYVASKRRLMRKYGGMLRVPTALADSENTTGCCGNCRWMASMSPHLKTWKLSPTEHWDIVNYVKSQQAVN